MRKTHRALAVLAAIAAAVLFTTYGTVLPGNPFAPVPIDGASSADSDGNLTVTKVSLVKGGDTAVKTIKTVNAKSGAIYNLAGQKVSADYKGVAIVNGKKVILK